MRKLKGLYFFLIVGILMASCGMPEDMRSTSFGAEVTEEGIIKYRGELYNGRYHSYAIPESYVTVKNGILDGKYVLYSQDPYAGEYKGGAKLEEGNYLNGQLDGPFYKYNEQEDTIEYFEYKNGIKQGPSWRKSENSFVTCNYEEGKLNGDYTEYYIKEGKKVLHVSGTYYLGEKYGVWKTIEEDESYWSTWHNNRETGPFERIRVNEKYGNSVEEGNKRDGEKAGKIKWYRIVNGEKILTSIDMYNLYGKRLGSYKHAVVDIDGNEYLGTKIGNQIWINENLNVSKFRNGDTILQAVSIEEWAEANKNKQPAWCYLYNSSKRGEKYGKLYNWYAVIDERGLAPEGWHIPSALEWEEFENYLNSNGHRGKIGHVIKSKYEWGENYYGAENYYNWSALPGGARDRINSIKFHLRQNFRKRDESEQFSTTGACWWSTTKHSHYKNCAEGRSLSNVAGYQGDFYNTSCGFESGYSVRCLKDYE